MDAENLMAQSNLARPIPLLLKALFIGGAHIVLAILMRENTAIATMHALGTFALGAWFLLFDKTSYRVLLIAAYITGAELLWRMTFASIYWESAKYAVTVLLVLELVKQRQLKNVKILGIVYLILLAPSILVLADFDREAISYNLSGPVALAAGMLYFSVVHLTSSQVRGLLLAMLAPIVGVAALVLQSTASASAIAFTQSSNFVTSADTGPNQVSSIMGLGALAAILCALTLKRQPLLSLALLACSSVLIVQATLTFSRGGLFTMFGALLIALGYLLKQNQTRWRVIAYGTAFAIAAAYFVIPALDEFTQGNLVPRFTDLSPTGRDAIVASDLEAFGDHPLFGTGPGGSRAYHLAAFRSPATHTEYSRMLAEHGIYGLASLFVLLWFTWRRIRMRSSPETKAVLISLLMWGLIFMSHSAMRMVAPSFLIGISAATIVGGERVIPREAVVGRDSRTLGPAGAGPVPG